MFKPVLKALSAAAIGLGLSAGAQAAFVNGSFEDPFLNGVVIPGPPADFKITDQMDLVGWRTTAADGAIEIWRQPGPIAVNAYLGNQFAELNANLLGGLYQDVTGIAGGSIVGWELAHRGRTGNDTMRLVITDAGADNAINSDNAADAVNADNTILFSQEFTTGLNWAFYSGTGLMAMGNDVRFLFEAVSTANGDLSTGNFLDATNFGVGVGLQVPEPASLLLLGTALLGVGVARRGKKSA